MTPGTCSSKPAECRKRRRIVGAGRDLRPDRYAVARQLAGSADPADESASPPGVVPAATRPHPAWRRQTAGPRPSQVVSGPLRDAFDMRFFEGESPHRPLLARSPVLGHRGHTGKTTIASATSTYRTVLMACPGQSAPSLQQRRTAAVCAHRRFGSELLRVTLLAIGEMPDRRLCARCLRRVRPDQALQNGPLCVSSSLTGTFPATSAGPAP
jgi:hypothetical protein